MKSKYINSNCVQRCCTKMGVCWEKDMKKRWKTHYEKSLGITIVQNDALNLPKSVYYPNAQWPQLAHNHRPSTIQILGQNYPGSFRRSKNQLEPFCKFINTILIYFSLFSREVNIRNMRGRSTLKFLLFSWLLIIESLSIHESLSCN